MAAGAPQYSILSEAELYRYSKAFHEAQTGDGEITVDKVWPVVEALREKMARRDVEALVRTLNDKARRAPGGVVDFAELLVGLSALIHVRARGRCRSPGLMGDGRRRGRSPRRRTICAWPLPRSTSTAAAPSRRRSSPTAFPN
jgi:hypothetical protein